MRPSENSVSKADFHLKMWRKRGTFRGEQGLATCFWDRCLWKSEKPLKDLTQMSEELLTYEEASLARGAEVLVTHF